jgi:hypothetical protein
MLTLLPCPDLDCDATAELLDRTVLQSTDGPFPLVKVQCVRGHNFLMPADARYGTGQNPKYSTDTASVRTTPRLA